MKEYFPMKISTRQGNACVPLGPVLVKQIQLDMANETATNTEWGPPCNSPTHCHNPDRRGVQLRMKIMILWTLGTNGTRHIPAPRVICVHDTITLGWGPGFLGFTPEATDFSWK